MIDFDEAVRLTLALARPLGAETAPIGDAGGPSPRLEWARVRLAADLPATGERETFYRARRAASGLEPLSDQDSGAQKPLTEACALVRRRAGTAAAGAGEEVEALEF